MMDIDRGQRKEQRRAPAYIPLKTFLTAVETLQQGLPKTLDRSVWPSFAGGAQSQTLGAFKFLKLIDEEGTVQPLLHSLVGAKGDDRKAILRDIIKREYADAIQLGEANASFQGLSDLFRGYGIQGGTLERAIRFFLDACSYTGLKGSPLWTKAKKTFRRLPKKEDGPKVRPTVGQELGAKSQSSIKTIQLRSSGTLTLSLSADIMALSKEDREWLFLLIDQLNAYGQQGDNRTK